MHGHNARHMSEALLVHVSGWGVAEPLLNLDIMNIAKIRLCALAYRDDGAASVFSLISGIGQPA